MRGRRIALAAAAGVLGVLAGAIAVREDIAAWFVGYRFYWLPPGFEAWPGSALNAAGELLIYEDNATTGLPRAGVWSPRAGEVAFIELPRGMEGWARPGAINDRGVVVGVVCSREGPLRSDVPFVWQRGSGMQILPALGAEDISFHDINSRDQAVGFVVGGMRMDGKRSQAALLTPGLGFRFLEGQGTEEMAMSINESGWIAGATTGRDKRHPVLWRPPDFRQQDLGLPAGFDDGVAVGINDRGVVLVHLWSSPMTARPFLWTEERGYRELPVPGGYTRILGVSLDGRGTVLLQAEQGYGLVRDERSFLTRNGAILAIPQPRGAREVQYRLLNDRGWLAGTAKRNVAPDLERGFVAKPVP